MICNPLQKGRNDMMKVIFDSDNTAGIPERPMDDALALLYLLGRRHDVEIAGITCCPANGTADEVYRCFSALLGETGYTDIPLLRGSDLPSDPDSDAARFIDETVSKYPGEITYLGIGSLGNLYSAFLRRPSVMDDLSRIVLMGGITEPLFYHGDMPLDELNFAFNAEASDSVLRLGHDITVMTGNNCLDVSEFPQDEFLSGLDVEHSPGGAYTAGKCGYRFVDKQRIYGASSSYCWDGVAAVYLLHPEFFEDHITPCLISISDMEYGFLRVSDEHHANAMINIPIVRSRSTLQSELYHGWRDLSIIR